MDDQEKGAPAFAGSPLGVDKRALLGPTRTEVVSMSARSTVFLPYVAHMSS